MKRLTGVHLHKVDEGLVGIGARFDYNVTTLLAADMASGNFGETRTIMGVRLGKALRSLRNFHKRFAWADSFRRCVRLFTSRSQDAFHRRSGRDS